MKYMDFKELSEYLAEARIKKGFSQGYVAKKLGYGSAQFVSNWERSCARPPISKGRALIKLLDLDRNKYVDLHMLGSARILKRGLKG